MIKIKIKWEKSENSGKRGKWENSSRTVKYVKSEDTVEF